MIYIGSLHCILTKDLLTVDISITLYNVKVALRKPYCPNTFLKHNHYESVVLISYTLSSSRDEKTSEFNENLCAYHFWYKYQKLIPKASPFK